MPGIKHIIRLNEKIEDDSDIWLSFELGKRALSEWLCSKQKHVVNGDQIYSIQHQLFYLLLQQDPSSLVDLVSQICEFLKVLSQFRLVHANLRPKNILCEFDGNKSVLEDIQISGFSNCFKFDDLKKIRS
jgi:serine/threonine protein kinase